MKRSFVIVAAVLLLPLIVTSCASTPAVAKSESQLAPVVPPPPPPAPPLEPEVALLPGSVAIYRTPALARRPMSDDENKVVVSAKSLLGQKPNAKAVVKGKQFTLDCIGTVSASFYGADIDIKKDFDKYTGNGVNCLYMTLKDHEVLFKDTYPRPGDVIIWDNTWDANGDGDRTNDLRTHAGLVISVDDDGTIAYLHENLYTGVVIEFMNLLRPDLAWDENEKRLNSGLAIATKSGGPKPKHWLAGDVFNAFGDVLKLKDYLSVVGTGAAASSAAPAVALAGE